MCQCHISSECVELTPYSLILLSLLLFMCVPMSYLVWIASYRPCRRFVYVWLWNDSESPNMLHNQVLKKKYHKKGIYLFEKLRSVFLSFVKRTSSKTVGVALECTWCMSLVRRKVHTCWWALPIYKVRHVGGNMSALPMINY